VKPHEHAVVLLDAVEFGRPVGLGASDQKVVMVARTGLAQHGLQINAAAG